jgi:hypothetical protein
MSAGQENRYWLLALGCWLNRSKNRYSLLAKKTGASQKPKANSQQLKAKS